MLDIADGFGGTWQFGPIPPGAYSLSIIPMEGDDAIVAEAESELGFSRVVKRVLPPASGWYRFTIE
jgi:hypothetical protein